MAGGDRPESSRDAFEASARRWAGGEGPRLLLQQSVDDYLNTFPLDPVDDEQLNDLHRAALRTIVMRHVGFLSNDFERAAMQCASPIERAMLYAVALVAWDWTDSVLLRVEGIASGLFSSRSVALEIEPQATVGKYRVDFLLTLSAPLPADPNERRSVQMALECDGHNWHERSRQSRRRAIVSETELFSSATWRSSGTPARTSRVTCSSTRTRLSASSRAGSAPLSIRSSVGPPDVPRAPPAVANVTGFALAGTPPGRHRRTRQTWSADASRGCGQ